MRVLPRIAFALLLTALAGAGIYAATPQGPGGRPPGPPDPDHHIGGRLTAVSGSTISVKNREGEALQFNVTAETTYERNGSTAKLTDFVVDDFVFAEGARDASGTFVATRVGGGDQPPRHRGFPGPPDGEHAVAGKVIAVDAGAKTITLQGPENMTEVVYTTDTTKVERNHDAATLADFTTNDHAFATGARNSEGHFVADRIMGGDKGPGKHHGDGN